MIDYSIHDRVERRTTAEQAAEYGVLYISEATTGIIDLPQHDSNEPARVEWQEQVKSSSGAGFYTVTRFSDGLTECTCPHNTYRRLACKHMPSAELARMARQFAPVEQPAPVAPRRFTAEQQRQAYADVFGESAA